MFCALSNKSVGNVIFSFYKKEPQEKHDQNEADSGLLPKLFLPEEIPEKMTGEIKDDEMIDIPHFFTGIYRARVQQEASRFPWPG
jgi:hypothetical protein